MPQHVEMHRQREAGTPADHFHEPVDGVRRERRTALGCENVDAVRVFLAESLRISALVTRRSVGSTCRFSLHGATSFRREIIDESLDVRDQLTG